MSGDVIAEIKYFHSTKDGCPPSVVPYSIETEERSNIEHECVDMIIHDLRGKESSVDLDTNGFEILKYNGVIQEEFEQESELQKTYYQEISNILKQRLGASKVLVYNDAFRSRGVLKSDEKHDANHREPALYIHVDIDAAAVRGLVEILLGKEEGEKAMKNRVQVINVWRPIGSNPITKKPLTICDYKSVNPEKNVHSYTVQGARLHSAGYLISRDPLDSHKWYYLSQMKSDEMFVFKMADTKLDVARFACHTAFSNPCAPAPMVQETSLEVRCVAFYDE